MVLWVGFDELASDLISLVVPLLDDRGDNERRAWLAVTELTAPGKTVHDEDGLLEGGNLGNVRLKVVAEDEILVLRPGPLRLEEVVSHGRLLCTPLTNDL